MRFPNRLLSFVSILSAALVLATNPRAAASAAEPSTPGALLAKQADGATVEMPLRRTKVSIEVTAFVARATIEQEFVNPFTDPVEAVYTFPLGHRAAVDDFELAVGDRTIRGTIKRREEARAVYEQARSAGFQAALLEQERPNIFVQSVANLEPGKPVTVRLRTIETLPYERGAYRLAFPLVVGPRYVPGGVAAASANSAPPYLKSGQRSGHDVEIVVAINAGVPLTDLQSPSHRTVVMKSSARGATVRLAGDDTIPNKDFLLRWSVSADKPALGLLTHRDGLDGFFTLLVQPKGEIGPAEAMPKEITFVLDTSGSMRGTPLEASKRFAARALRALGPRDTFNLIRFAGDNHVFSTTALPNERGAVESAISWFQTSSSGGGTEMLAALKAAFARPADPNRVRVVVFLTDGYVGNTDEILAAIRKHLGEARIYTVGIGGSVNHDLLDRMSRLGRGAYVFVRPDDTADDAFEAFRSWVTLPYLTDLTIDWGALPIADVSPERLQDLGSGQTLSVVGRYLAAGEGDVVVRGKLGGRYWEQQLHVVLPERAMSGESLAALWARGRIDELLRAPDDPSPEAVEAEVTALALHYRLMSPYTSFVAVDDSRVVNTSGESRTVHQAVPVPEGVAGGDAGGGLGGVAGGVVGGVKGGVEGGVPGGVVADGSELAERVVVLASTGASDARGSARVTSFSSAFVNDLPVAGRFYQNALALARGVQGATGDGNPNVEGARERDFKTVVVGEPVPAASSEPPPSESSERLRESAFRVLADLADDGRLSPAEGIPALAALVAAQRPSGAIAGDVATHAIATWALAEAAAELPNDRAVAQAWTKSLEYLIALKEEDGWPARRGGTFNDAEATQWAKLALGLIRPAEVLSNPSAKPGARSPYDRLVRTAGRGHLTIAKAS